MQVTINQGAPISRLFPTQKDPAEPGEASYGFPVGGWASRPDAVVLPFSGERALSGQSSRQVDRNAHFRLFRRHAAPIDLVAQGREGLPSPQVKLAAPGPAVFGKEGSVRRVVPPQYPSSKAFGKSAPHARFHCQKPVRLKLISRQS